MKLKAFSLISFVILLSIALCSCTSSVEIFDLYILPDTERIKDGCSVNYGNTTALVTEGGDCYIRGGLF